MAATVSWSSFAPSVRANGIYRDGVGARAMALGGADVGFAADPLGAMAANPAGLGFLTAPEFDLGVNTGIPFGHFTKSPTSDGRPDSNPGVFPDAAIASRIGNSPVTLGLSFITDTADALNWRYVDPPGGIGGVSYGNQKNQSEIIVFRTSLGVGVALNPKWSIGASLGLDYNQNHLQAPYIFQSQPGLAGAKTLLDLRTDGFGWNGQVGILYQPMEELQFGASYKSPTTIFSHGDANGDAGLQVGASSFPFHYDAQVKNVLPQMVTGGASWKFDPRWRLALQLDWVNWGGAFTQLPVSLHNGSNPGLPATINDNVPLNWRDEFVYRGGLEFYATTNLTLRAGYCYGASPVPNQTLTPLTAAIPEHTLTAGIGWRWSKYSIDAAYQFSIPAERIIGTSGLLSGEYSSSSIYVGYHTLMVSTGVKF